MKKHFILACAAFLLATAGNALAITHAFIWDATNGLRDLGSLGLDSYGKAVNDSGTVTGNYIPVDKFYQHGFVWTEATGMVDLGIPGGGDSTTAKCEPTAINAAGNIVGSARQVDGDQVAFFWSPTGGFITLGDRSSSFDNGNTAYAINDLDQVTGNLRTKEHGATYHAYLWSPEMTRPRDLGTLNGGQYSVGWAINNLGHIAGNALADTASHFEPTLWTKQTGIVLLGTLADSIYAQPTAINDAGQVIGINQTGTADQAFYKGPSGEIKILKGLGGNSTYALVITEQGVIYGVANDAASKTYGVMWPTPSNKPVLLTTLDPALATAIPRGVNNLGQIVGEYSAP